MINKLTLEALAFQSTDFFDELTAAITELRNGVDLSNLNRKKFFDGGRFDRMAAVIQKYTNLEVKFKNGDASGFATEIIFVNANHIFLDQDMVNMYKEFDASFNPTKDIDALFKAIEKKKISGYVDIKKGKVSGAFTKLPVHIYTPIDLMTHNTLTPAEVAAVTLHEIGHTFTMFEMAGRTATTNHVLSNLSRILDKSYSEAEKEMVFTKAAKYLEMSGQQTEVLKKSKSSTDIAVILLDQDIEKCKSELGASVYDFNSCEWLADQYANRCGAGKHLVTGLDKILAAYWQTKWKFRFISLFLTIIFVLVALDTAWFAVAIGTLAVKGEMFYAMLAAMATYTKFMILVAMVDNTDKKNQIYDRPLARMERIKRDNVERLKDPDLDAATRKQTLDTIRGIEEVTKSGRFTDELMILETVVYYLSPNYRAAHKYELLQKELEAIASNDLFTAAAALKTV